jgi:hypothetical protein
MGTVINLKDIPSILRKRKLRDFTGEDRKIISDILFVKELIQDCYKKQAKIVQETIERKREAGYCGGYIYCLNYTGEKFSCKDCKNQRANPQYHKKLSRYGEIRRVERFQEKNRKQKK